MSRVDLPKWGEDISEYLLISPTISQIPDYI